jgi:predicted dehydrogenase
MGSTVKLAVIGVGHLGQHHARIYTELPGVALVAVADISEARRREVGSRLKIPAVADYRELLGRVDGVSVAVPTGAHHEVARAFLAAGSDVLIEKPITGTVADADELIALAARGGRILQVGHSERYNGAVQALAKLVQDPAFIEVHRMGPFPGRGTDVDVVLDLMIHDLDIILTLVKSDVTAVSAVGVPVVSDRVDIASARLEFASG